MPVLAATVIVTDPLSIPLVGERLTQERFSDVVHAQLELVTFTETELVPPLEEKFSLVGEMLYVHDVQSAFNGST